MNILMGPMLGLRDVSNNTWQLSALFVSKDDGTPDKLTVHAGAHHQTVDPAALLKSLGTAKVWRYDFAVPQSASEQKVQYLLPGPDRRWTFFVPAARALPRIAYASCNGFSDPRDRKKVSDKNERWKNMAEMHNSAPYHLLLMGGDQVYADTIWEAVSSVNRWSEKPAKERNKAPFTAITRRQVERFYFDLYCNRWAQPEPALLFASVPSLMMWDDHDIFDGWGPYPEKQQTSPMYQGIFEIAREHFAVFQQRIKLGDRPAGGLSSQGNFSYLHRLGAVAVLALDMRSERSQSQVLSPRSWREIYAALDGLDGCKHLFVLSSIPVVHPDFSLLETALGIIPGQQELEDDLKDHWHSRSHKTERLRLIHRLLKFANEKKTRVTLLSGDVHVGAVSIIESQRAEAANNHANIINQLTSSAIVHPAPPGLMSFALEFLSREPERVDRGITARMLEFLGTRRRFIMARNWLGLEPDGEDDRIWVNWYVEGEDDPYTKAIHPVRA